MTLTTLTRDQLLAKSGVLLIVDQIQPPSGPVAKGGVPVVKPKELGLFIAVNDDGQVYGFNGHVDLGTGIRTSLAQIVAEELDLALEQVCMVLGDTDSAPNQGATIASATIQITAIPANSTGRRNTFDRGVYGTTRRMDAKINGPGSDAFSRCAVTS